MSDDWVLPPLRAGRLAPEGILARRDQIAGLAALHKDDVTVPREQVSIGGVPCVELGEAGAGPVIIFLHGGGYRLGQPATWVGFLSHLARRGNLRFVLPAYRLAPEDPFPAALHDAVAVYRTLRARSAGPLLLMGDSAGGGLAAALTVAAQANEAPLPDGLMLISPWLDLTLDSTTYETHAERDTMFSRASAAEAAELYLQGRDPMDALASPLHADVSGFPPTQIFCGGDEVLLGDALAFTARLAKANRTVEAHFVQGMQHVWPMIAPHLPEARAVENHVIRFARAFGGAG